MKIILPSLSAIAGRCLAVVAGFFSTFQPARRIVLDSGDLRAVRFLSGFRVNPEEAKATSWITLTRTGNFTDPRYGNFSITREMLLNMIQNFERKVYGQDVFIDVAHEPEKGAAAKVLKLELQGDRLRAFVEWTEMGIDAVTKRGFRYLSLEYHENYQDNETRKTFGATMLGAGLVTRPCIKRLDPIELSEAREGVATLFHPELIRELREELNMKFAELIKACKDALAAKKLRQEVIDATIKALTESLQTCADEAAAKGLIALAEGAAIKLNEQMASNAPGTPVTATINLSAAGLDEAGVIALMDKRRADEEAAQRKLTEARASRVRVLSEAINAASGIAEADRAAAIKELQDLITPDMTDEQVKNLAAFTIGQLNKAATARQLGQIGFSGHGSTQIIVVNDDAVKLQGLYHDQLKKTESYADRKLKLQEKLAPFTEKVLKLFDQINGARLNAEVRMLASGQVGMVDTNLPVGFQREVIREALADLRILELINADIDPNATTTTQIPYETRDVANVFNDGVVFEGQPINYGGINQAMDTAYINPMKVAMLISNEVAHFSASAAINWDAMGRNIESNARLMRELIARRLTNELQRSADMFGAVAVTNEAFDAQLTGSNSIIKTTQFPIVRPFQQKDLKGSNIGSAEAAIAVTLNGTVLAEYDGTGTQAAATYWRLLNANLGYIQLVNQLGVAVTPADSGTNTISYTYATNVTKVDLDLGSLTLGQARNKILQAIGARKAILSDQRFVKPDFLLMSETLNEEVTNADQFTMLNGKNGTDLTAQGDLGQVKATAAYSTNTPSTNLGTERVLIGQRGLLGYRIAKPYVMGQPFEVVNGSGVPVGKKQAYGEEYSAIKCPTPVRGRMTSVIAYSFTGR